MIVSPPSSATLPGPEARGLGCSRTLRGAVIGLGLLALLALGATAVLRAAALWRAIDTPPGVIQTSGAEEESLFAIWRFAHDEPVYRDPRRMPYASAYFNWLFYASYGAAARPALAAGGPAAYLKTVRAVTLGGAVLGCIVLSWYAVRLLRPQGPAAAVAGATLAAFVFFGPLTGWWIMTARPDLWGLVWETIGAVWLLCLHRRRPWLAVLGVALACQAAWAFKPTFLHLLIAATLFLASLRRWRHAAALVALSALGWGAAISLLGQPYLAALHDTAVTNRYYISAGLQSARDAALKLAPLVVLLLARFPVRGPGDTSDDDAVADARRLALIGTPLALALSFAGTCKLGAASNYYFTSSLLLALWGLTRLARARHDLRPALVLTAGVLALGLIAATRQPWRAAGSNAAELAARWQLYASAPAPRFSSDLRLNLPWLNPRSPPLVLGYNYALDRESGRTFERGGVGGLIREEYFAALLLRSDYRESYDRASLAGYEPRAAAGGMTMFLRRTPTEPGSDTASPVPHEKL